jgi:hypothetical protein
VLLCWGTGEVSNLQHQISARGAFLIINFKIF